MESLSGDVQLEEILTECNEFKIFLLGLFVKIMILLRQEG